MPRSGPFTIDGEEFSTDDAGNISRTIPAVPEETSTITKRRLQVLRARKAEERRVAQGEADKVARLNREVDELDTLITNAKEIGIGAIGR